MTQLTAETRQLMDGFEQRMKFMDIVKCLVNASKPEDIRAAVPDSESIDNLVMAVLVFIMEHTLRYEAKCGLNEISGFLAELCPAFEIPAEAAPRLAQYIVVTVLQNGGRPREFTIWDSGKAARTSIILRLIREEGGSYQLTDDACDFLFRTKEIDSELDFSVARFRMSELMKRSNYNEALAQSRELVARIRGMKAGMESFLVRCRENIRSVPVDAYENTVTRIRALLEEEDEPLEQLQRTADEHLRLANASGTAGAENEKVQQSRIVLREIVQNIALTIQEQRELINRRSDMGQMYRQFLKDSLSMRNFQRYKMEDELLKPFWETEGDWTQLGSFAAFLLAPLCRPQLNSFFSIENFYAPQRRLGEQGDEEIVDLVPEENPEQLLRAQRNARYKNIVRQLFLFMREHTVFSVQDYIGQLSLSALLEQCEENALPQVFLSLYESDSVSIEEWKNAGTAVREPNGEFELSWCLAELPPELLWMREILVANPEESISFELSSEQHKTRITITNFRFEVK